VSSIDAPKAPPLRDPLAGVILGIGQDLVHVPRMAALVGKWGQRFLDRVFTAGEQAYCRARQDPAPHLAARFAAKEAFYKAIARGRELPLYFRDAEVVHEPRAGLSLRLSEKAQRIAAEAGVGAVHLTLTHDGEYAAAVVVLERG